MAIALIFFAVGGVAGFIDAIAGGGGLITLPALLFAGLPPQQALATNKGQSVFGSWTGLIAWKLALPMAAGQIIGGLAGASLTIRRGRALVRWVTVAVCLALLVRLICQMARGH